MNQERLALIEKIIKRAGKHGTSCPSITEKLIREYPGEKPVNLQRAAYRAVQQLKEVGIAIEIGARKSVADTKYVTHFIHVANK